MFLSLIPPVVSSSSNRNHRGAQAGDTVNNTDNEYVIYITIGVGLFIWAFLFSGFWTQELFAEFQELFEKNMHCIEGSYRRKYDDELAQAS